MAIQIKLNVVAAVAVAVVVVVVVVVVAAAVVLFSICSFHFWRFLSYVRTYNLISFVVKILSSNPSCNWPI